jgi:cell division protein FtsN
MGQTLMLVIAALVLLAIIVAIVLVAGKKKKERNRLEADRLREEAAARGPELQKREAAARETEAEAAAARAEAERRQAQADRLEAEAADRHRAAGDVRDEHHGRLQQADELDPRVNTKSKEYTGPDTAGSISARAGDRDGVRDVDHDGRDEQHDTSTFGTSGTDRDTTPDRLDSDQHDTRSSDPDQGGGGAHRVV